MADNEAGRALQKDDIFRIASQTKAITATAVMMLWEEGSFNWMIRLPNTPELQDAGLLKTFTGEDGSWTTEPAARRSRCVLVQASPAINVVLDEDCPVPARREIKAIRVRIVGCGIP